MKLKHNYIDEMAIEMWNNYEKNKKKEQEKLIIDTIWNIEKINCQEKLTEEEYKKIKEILFNVLTR